MARYDYITYHEKSGLHWHIILAFRLFLVCPNLYSHTDYMKIVSKLVPCLYYICLSEASCWGLLKVLGFIAPQESLALG